MQSHMYNQAKVTQTLEFDGLMFNNDPSMMPTDIDCIFEIKDVLYLLYEVKVEGKDYEEGQRITQTRMIDDFTKAGKFAVLVRADHNVYDTSKNIRLCDLPVLKYYYRGVWYEDIMYTTVIDFQNDFISHVRERIGKILPGED